MNHAFFEIVEESRRQLGFLLGLLLLLWGICFYNEIQSNGLDYYGILPRSADHVWHIFSAPFLHGSIWHLTSNTLPLLVFSWICIIRGWLYYFLNSIFIIALGGLGVWLFGRQAIHLGASGWIFGLWGLIVARAVFDKDLRSIVVAIVILMMYGGMIFGIFPGQPEISYEAHLFGFLAGCLAAWLSSFICKLLQREDSLESESVKDNSPPPVSPTRRSAAEIAEQYRARKTPPK